MWNQDNSGDSATERIGEKLRQIYDEIADEELPSRFTDLLEQLKDADSDPSDQSDY